MDDHHFPNFLLKLQYIAINCGIPHFWTNHDKLRNSSGARPLKVRLLGRIRASSFKLLSSSKAAA
jgi:hypothetical protein